MQVPVNIYSEMTPNPSTMKFVANKYLLLTGESIEFTSTLEAKGFSPFAEELLKFPFVERTLYFSDNTQLINSFVLVFPLLPVIPIMGILNLER